MQASGLIKLDHQTIPIKGYQPIDLLGFHVYKQFNDWLYLGIGGHAPLVSGAYGGFMVFDASIEAQRRLFGHVFADAGASIGGGGGGHSMEQSKIISGAGGFQKRYVGLGYRFEGVSIGVNLSKVRFTESAIDRSQLELYAQVPFRYYVDSYAHAGDPLRSIPHSDHWLDSFAPASTRLEIGLDNAIQLRPTGSFRGSINLLGAQFDYLAANNSYVFVQAGVGYRGLPMYNQVLAGVGYAYSPSPRIGLRGQVALGSGGYAPESIDTGPGLLIYPKVSAEYRLSKHVGIAVSGGYLFAPKGTSRNLMLGANLSYHVSAADPGRADGDGTSAIVDQPYRVHVFGQAALDAKVDVDSRGTLGLLVLQVDRVVSRHVYVPAQVSVGYNRYLGFPGYGELLAGLGVQSEYKDGDRFQSFAQLLVGTNVNRMIIKPAVGVNVGLSDQVAIYGQVGATYSLFNSSQHPKLVFKSPTLGLGITYRFARPHAER